MKEVKNNTFLSDNDKKILESKKNIKARVTITIVSTIFIMLFSPFVSSFGLSVIISYTILSFASAQVLALKYHGSFVKNIKNILEAKRNIENIQKEKVVKQHVEIINLNIIENKNNEEMEKYNQRQKELELAFSDENYYPYIQRIKSKTLKLEKEKNNE